MGFTPGLTHSRQPWLNPKAGKLMRMANAGFAGHDTDGIQLNGIDMIHCDEDGRIDDFKVMVRPLKAVNKIHEMMGAMLKKLG